MKHIIAIAVLAVMMLSLFGGIVAEEVEANGDKNANDYNDYIIPPGAGTAPADSSNHAEDRTGVPDA